MATYRKEERKKDWRKSGWAKATEAGLYAASRFHPAASLAYDGVGALTGFNTEKKYYDVSGSAQLTNGYLNVGSGVILTNVTNGTAGNQRTGISIKLTDFQIRITITPIANPTGVSYLRLFLIYDREGDVVPGTALTLTDLLQDASTTLSRLQSPLNVTQFGRFQILKDVLYQHANAGYSDDKDITDHDWTFGPEKLHEHHLLWQAGGGGASTTGHIYLLACSMIMYNNGAGVLTQDVTTNNQPFITYWARSRFVDN